MTAAIVVSILFLVALLAIVLVAIDYLTRWPEPTEDTRPFHCDRCVCTFRDARWLAMHHRAQHPNTYEAS